MTQTIFAENSTPQTTLFERVGGEAAVDKLTMLFYTKMMDDTRVNHYFSNIDLMKQIQHQKSFLTYVLGGKTSYNGKNMRAAHSHLKLTSEDFDAVAENLWATLQELGVDTKLSGEIMQLVASTKDDVLNR